MVILFSDRNSKSQKEIIKILNACGADFITDKAVYSTGNFFEVLSLHKAIDLKLKKGIVIFADESNKFKEQTIPQGTIGICDIFNENALGIFKKNKTPVIGCGINQKSTITLSSINNDCVIATLQRTVCDIYGRKILPGDYKIKLNSNYSHFSVMCCFAVITAMGLTVDEF